MTAPWTPSMEQRRKYRIAPYLTEDGAMVADHLAWRGQCSACGERMILSVGIDRPGASLLYPNGTAKVVESSYDNHVCEVHPYRLSRPTGPADMAHPMAEARFVPDYPSELFEMLFR